MKNFNAPTYHDCCLCFSKRGFAKKAGHPELQSASLLKIPTLRNVESPEGLYEWIRNRMEIHSRIGRRPVFPSINNYHSGQIEQEETEVEEEKREYLSKRFEELTSKQREALEKIRQLTEDNNKLLASSKSWCIKYQELLTSQDKDNCSYTDGSPQKVLKQDEHNDDFLLL